MDGTTDTYVFIQSENELQSPRGKARLIFGYNCEYGTIYVRLNGLGLHLEDVDCYTYACYSRQYGRIKIDDAPPRTAVFDLWDDNSDGMNLNFMRDPETRDKVDRDVLLEEAKSGQKMLVEVTAQYTDGVEQIGRFNLDGLADALGQCPAPKPN